MGKRAPTSEESKMYCGYSNVSLMNGLSAFDGELLVGPRFESMFELYQTAKNGITINEADSDFIKQRKKLYLDIL